MKQEYYLDQYLNNLYHTQEFLFCYYLYNFYSFDNYTKNKLLYFLQQYPSFNYQEWYKKFHNNYNIFILPVISDDECTICLDKNTDCITSCNHNYHYECIMKWIETNNICPSCRKSL